MSISLINMLFKNLSTEHFWFSEGLAFLRGLTQVFSKNFLSLDFLEGKDEFWTFSPSIEKYSIPKRAPPSPLLRISYLSILSPVPPSGRRWIYGVLMQIGRVHLETGSPSDKTSTFGGFLNVSPRAFGAQLKNTTFTVIDLLEKVLIYCDLQGAPTDL